MGEHGAQAVGEVIKGVGMLKWLCITALVGLCGIVGVVGISTLLFSRFINPEGLTLVRWMALGCFVLGVGSLVGLGLVVLREDS